MFNLPYLRAYILFFEKRTKKPKSNKNYSLLPAQKEILL